MRTSQQPTTNDAIMWCCDEFASAVEVTFAMPVHGPTGWLLYGTDAETVGAGLPELRYWAAQFCPFCGTRLRPYPGDLPRSREFGFADELTDSHRQRDIDGESGNEEGLGEQ